MAKPILDRLKEGDFLTADYVRTYGLIESASFNRLFELEPRLSMTADDVAEFKVANDTGVVFKIISRNRQILFDSWEFATNQTGTQGAKELYAALNYYYESARTT